MKKYPAEIMDIVNSYLAGEISSGRLLEFFDDWVDVNPIKSAYEAKKEERKRIVNIIDSLKKEENWIGDEEYNQALEDLYSHYTCILE